MCASSRVAPEAAGPGALAATLRVRDAFSCWCKSKGEIPREKGTMSSLQAFFSLISPLQTPPSLG